MLEAQVFVLGPIILNQLAKFLNSHGSKKPKIALLPVEMVILGHFYQISE